MLLRIDCAKKLKPHETCVIEHDQLPDNRYFLVHGDDGLRAYENSCPHTGAPLDWMPGVFLSADKSYIQCSTHDAMFQLSDGLCLRGPCVGQSLTSVRLQIEGEVVYGEFPVSPDKGFQVE